MSLIPAEDARSLASKVATSQNQQSASATELPTVVIEPRRGRLNISLRELWTYHELLYFLAWRDVKVRYKQTLLGVAWVILQPFCMIAVFSLIFGRVVAMPSDGIPYPIFAFAGILPWTFLSTALTTSGNSMVNSAHLVTKVYFPRVLVPVASVGAALVDFAITLVLLVPLVAYYRIQITINILMLPVLTVLLVFLALACGILTSAINVKYRDVRIILPFVVQLWFFGSPIIYPSSILPERWRLLLSLNPMTGIIEGFRTALLGHRNFQWSVLAASAIITTALLIYALATFRRMEKSFADVI